MVQVPQSVTNAGEEFNYSVWTQGTNVTLANVPWGSDYRDIVEFDSPTALTTYVNESSGVTVRMENISYIRFGSPISLPISFALASSFNYIRVFNPRDQHTDTGGNKAYYYFISHVEMGAPGTTRVYVQLDVWQTYGKGLNLGRAYVERGHVGIANNKQNEQDGLKYLTIPEGLDLGSEYLSKGVYKHKLQARKLENDSTVTVQPNVWNNASVIAVSSVSFLGSEGSIEDGDVKITSAFGSKSINGVPNGADIYFFETGEKFNRFLEYHKEKPWVTQGIMAAYMIPPILGSDVEGQRVSRGGSYASGGCDWVKLSAYPKVESFVLIPFWKDKLFATIPQRYRHLKKLGTYPYSFIEVTMYNGQPLVLKPESLGGSALGQRDLEMAVYRLITPPNPRMAVLPVGYNDGQEDPSSEIAKGEFLDFATSITSLPQISIVNNSYAGYLASNQNTINFQHDSASWSQQRALGSADTAFQQSSAQISAMGQSNALSVAGTNASAGLANETAAYRGLMEGTSGVLSNFGRGNAVGMVSGAAGAVAGVAITANQNTQAAGITNRMSTGKTQVGMNASTTIRDTNQAYAEFAASGDYANQIAGINARVQDAKMIQPTISGQSGGEAFTFSVLGGFEVHAKFKTIDTNVMTMICEFWLRYGYAVNRFHMMNTLNVMSKFTYWKVKELYIKPTVGGQPSCPEPFKQAIKGIFEKGVTVWASPDDIATLDVGDNVAKLGIVL